jgi:hypothetical protein
VAEVDVVAEPASLAPAEAQTCRVTIASSTMLNANPAATADG